MVRPLFLSLHGYSAFQDFHVFLVGDVTSTHGAEMRGLKLTVNKAASVLLEKTGKIDEGEFGGAGNEREHALAEETSTEGDAIETANEPSFRCTVRWLPNFNAGSKALSVEFGIGTDDVRSQPRSVFGVAVLGCSTAMDNPFEILVDGNGILSFVDELLHGMADVDFVGKDDKTLQGTIPQRLVAMVEGIPWEEPVAVSQQQTVHREVATDSYQPIVLALMRVWKPKLIIQLINRHPY